MTTKTKYPSNHWKQVVLDIMDIIDNVEGAGLPTDLDIVLARHDKYLKTTPLPQSVAKWFDELIDLMNNVEGAGLERELKSIGFPTAQNKASA